MGLQLARGEDPPLLELAQVAKLDGATVPASADEVACALPLAMARRRRLGNATAATYPVVAAAFYLSASEEALARLIGTDSAAIRSPASPDPTFSRARHWTHSRGVHRGVADTAMLEPPCGGDGALLVRMPGNGYASPHRDANGSSTPPGGK